MPTPSVGCVQALQPHVRIWDSVSLSTLQVIGLGTFERGVGSLAFSKAVSISQVHHGSCGTCRSALTLGSSCVCPSGLGPAPECGGRLQRPHADGLGLAEEVQDR